MPALGRGTGQALPTGTVTFLFTDVEGSTRLIQRAGSEYADLLQRHRVLLREACSGGVEFGSAGDALFFAFGEAADAIHAATCAQQAIERQSWPDGRRIRIRIGVHTGPVGVLGEDYVGVEVHRVARICSAAHGGQVLVSSDTAALMGDGTVLRNLGAFQLKDFDEPAELCQLVIDGVSDEFPAPRTSVAVQGLLPREVTSLIGRERELVEVRDLLRGHRLVTLTGAGGSGKTRLGLRVARNMVPTLGGPAGFVSLAPLDQADQAAGSVGRAFSQDGISSWDQVAEVLRRGPGLLVLDNTEHLPELSQAITKLLDATGELRVLVTSRTPVGVLGERLYPVEPLLEAPSVELLIERARAHTPAYDPDARELAELRGIAGQLDGLPLALELAAARLRSIPAAALRSRLDRQLDILKTTRDDVPERQRTIRATIQWSYDLLGEDDRLLLARLSVFAGPATMEAISYVGDLDDLDALDATSRLVDASLLRLRGGDDEPRYAMLEPVRQFAASELESAGKVAETQARMILWCAGRLGEFFGDGHWDGTAAEKFVSGEIENIMRLRVYVPSTSLADDVLTVMFVAANALYAFGLGDAPGAWAASVLDTGGFQNPKSRAMATILRAEGTDVLDPRVDFFLQALDAAEKYGDHDYIRIATIDLAERAMFLGDFVLMEKALARSFEVAIDPWSIALDRLLLATLQKNGTAAAGDAKIIRGNPSRSGPVWEAVARQRLAMYELVVKGDTSAAFGEVREMIATGRRHGHPGTVVQGSLLAVQLSFVVDDPAVVDNPQGYALQVIRTSRTYRDSETRLNRGLVLLVSAALLSRLGRDEPAAILVGALGDLLDSLPRDPDVRLVVPAEAVIDQARERLGDTRWVELTREGGRIDQPTAIERAEEWLEEACELRHTASSGAPALESFDNRQVGKGDPYG